MINNYSLYIYCLWVWILTLAYYNNIIVYSLLYSAFFAVLFTIIHSMISINNYNLF